MSDMERYFQGEDGKLYYVDDHGTTIEVRDKEEHQTQRKDDSHLRFFKDNPKQKARRSDAIQKRFETLVLDRADPGFHPDVKQVSDKQFIEDLRLNPKFKPLNTYIHKLKTSSGKVVRPVLKGEVGMIDATIYVLEGGESRVWTGTSFKEDSNGNQE